MILFYKRYVYKGKKANRPVINRNHDITKEEDLDIDVKKVLGLLPKPTAANNEVCFWMDNTAVSFAYMTIFTILGDGFQVKVPTNIEAEKKIVAFNKRINVNGDTIDDFIVDTWLDGLVHGFFLYRIANDVKGLDGEKKVGPDIQRIPPETIRVERDNVNGWRKFIQTAPLHQTFDTPTKFLNDTYMKNTPKDMGHNPITIPDDQRVVIYASLFRKPPMNTVLPFIVLKFWILAFMRKYAEKMWAPYTFGFVGDPKSNVYPSNPEDMDDALNTMSAALVKLKNFSVAAFPGDQRVEIKELGNKGSTYIDYLNVMNREIMFGLFSSIAARESSGVYKANQIADESTVRFMMGIRKKMENVLKRFYVMNLTPDIKEEDIVFVWPELRTSGIDNIANSIEKLATYGIFKDANERRRAAAQIFPFLAETDLTAEEISKMDKEFVEMNKPSQPQSEAIKNGSKNTKAQTASKDK